MKNITRFLKLIPFLILGITITFIACEDDVKFEDYAPDYTYSIIRSFVANGEVATIDHTNGIVNLTLASGSDISSVKVEMTLPEGASVDPSSGGTYDFSSGPVIFKVTNNGVTREYTVTIAAYGNPMIMSFAIGENVGEINQEEGIINITIGSQEDVTNLTPQFTIPDGTTADPQAGVSQNFTNPVRYTVLSNDGYTGKSYDVVVTQTEPPLISSFIVDGNEATIDNTNFTVTLLLSPTYDITNITPEITLPDGQSISPESGISQDFSDGSVSYTVTNTEELTQVYDVTVKISKTGIAFLGDGDDVNSIQDDDAKAAALFLQAQYPNDFNYIKFSDVSAETLENIKVVMLYYLSPLPNLGYSATSDNVMTMLPAELQPGTTQSNALTNWVKAGGDMFIAGDPTPFIHVLGRIPADYSQPSGLGNYKYTEFGCSGVEGCVDYNKPPEDIWGLGVRDSNNSGNRRTHPIYSGLEFVGDGELYLTNAATREVRLVWWQHMDGILSPGCCGQDAALLFEQTVNAVKLGTLRWIGDSFGYGAVEFLGTSGNVDANFDTNISTDFKGHVLTLENTIIGYEFDSNGTVNDYHSNIETLTTNIIGYLRTLDNDE
jgi:hypothetical protein